MKSLHIYIIRCTLLVAMLFAVSWTSIKAQTQVATPTFAWNGEQLTIATETEGADIYYSMSRYSAEPTGDGSEANPFNVAAAIAKCKEIGETASGETYYVKGIVSQITNQYGVEYGNATFNISDNGNNENYFTAYRVLYIGNQKYTEGQQQVQVGDDVVICGKLVNYKDNTPETAQNTGYLVSMATPELTTKYESPITVTGNTVVRANAIKQGLDASDVAMTYTGTEPYVVLSENNTVLTFFYDERKRANNGMGVGPFDVTFNNDDKTSTVTGREWEDKVSEIRTVVFDQSFANCKTIGSTEAWFCNDSNLVEIRGIEYLNTDNVTDMTSMFLGCKLLTSIDVSNFNTSNVRYIGGMFNDCTALTTLNVSNFNTSKVTDMRGMFYGCSSLTSLDLSHFDVSKVFNFNSMFRGCSKLENLNISGWTTSSAQSMQVMFGGCESLTSIDVSHFDTSNATNILQMFYGCRKLQSIDLSNFKTPNVTAMHGMFYRCESLESLDVSTFDTSKATSMYSLFAGCSSLVSLDISGFNTANVTSMTNMFSNCSALQTIYIGKDWSTASVTESGNMFTDCTNLKGGAGTTYDASHVDYTYAHIDGGESNPGYFTAATRNAEPYAVLSDNNTVLTFYYDDQKTARNGMSVGPFDSTNYNRWKTQRGWHESAENITKAVFDTSFDNCTTLTSTAFWFTYMTQLETIEHIEYLHTDNVEDMNCMFDSCYVLRDLDVSHFVTAKVTNMQCMFNRCEALTSLNLSNFNTSSCTFMRGMFYDCKGLTSLDLSSFNTSNNTSTEYMFQLCSSLENIIFGSGFSTENVTNMRGMFDGCSSLKSLNVGGFNTQKVSLMSIMFRGCSSLTSLDVSKFNTEKVTDMGGMFSGCEKLTNLDVSSFNTSNVTMMAGMFLECSALKSVDLKNFNTSQVTSMQSMFAGCKSLETLDVSHFDTGNVTNMKTMFSHCENLMSLDVTNFNTSKVLLFNGMFQVCPKLTTLDLSSFNTERATEMSFMFIQDSQLTDVNVGSFNTANVTTTYGMFAQTGLETLDLRNFDTHNVKDMNFMFAESTKLSTIYVGNSWSTANVEVGDSIFDSCPSLVGGQGTVFNPDNISVDYAHVDGGESNPGYFTAATGNAEPYAVLSDNNTVLTFYYDDQMNTRGGMNIADRGWSQDAASITKVQFDSTFVNYYPTSTNEWFSKCLNLTSIVGMENLKLDRTTDMSGMFLACTSLTSLDVSGFNTQQVTNMQDMFRACTNLTSLDLSKFNTQNVTEMYGMFYNCTNLKSLDLSNFDTRNVRNMDHLFRFCTNLVNLNISGFSTANGASQRNMFEGCSSLASIQAGNAVIADSIYAQIQNPNLLLYVNEASQAPQSVRNVVVGDVAEQIVLKDTVDNNNFYCPIQFTAKSISYTRNFRQTTQVGVSRGWETIALPFAVQTITHEKNGTLTPFGVEGGKPFWLKELTENGLVSAQRIDAYAPYLISMPNNSIYPDDYNQAGQVTFSATNAVVPVTESRETSGNNRTLIPTMMSVAQSPDIYVINRDTTYQNNPQGSIFVADYREVRPFEAYVKHVGGARYFSLSEIPQLDVTGIESIELQPWKGEQWWTLDGRKLNRRPSKKGIYIRNGKKVVVDATF